MVEMNVWLFIGICIASYIWGIYDCRMIKECQDGDFAAISVGPETD